MEPKANVTDTPSGTSSRIDDYRVRPAAEARSWAPVEERSWAPERRVYTHNPARFGKVAEIQPETETDVEPALRPPPHWMLAVAGAAIAALMGALLGGFLHI